MKRHLVPTDSFTEDLCGVCEECVNSCPVGALSPFKMDPNKCLLGMLWSARYLDEFKDIYLEHYQKLTGNTWKMCNTCQQACPIGRVKSHMDYGRTEDLE